MALFQDTRLGVVDSVLDSGTRTALKGAAGIEILETGGRQFVYVAGMDENGLTAFELKNDGTLSLVSSYYDNTTLPLGGAANMSSVVVGGQTYLYVNGAVDSGITVFLVAANGKLSPVQTVFDNGALNLALTEGNLTVASAGGNQFLIATGQTDDGLSVFKINSDGTLANTANVSDDAGLALAGAYSTTTLAIGASTFVFAAGYGDDGVSAFELNADGTLSLTDTIMDNGVLALNDPGGMAAATIGGKHYLFVGGEGEDGVTVLGVTSNGEFLGSKVYIDSLTTNLKGIRDIVHFKHEGQDYLSLTSVEGDVVSIASIAANGALTFAGFDDVAGPIGGAFDTEAVAVGDTTYLVTSGYLADGVYVNSIGGGSSTLIGTSNGDQMYGYGGDDTLIGFEGDDLLDGGAQADKLGGGTGNDIYIVDNFADVILEDGFDSGDQVKASASFALAWDDRIEILSTVDSTATDTINLTGNQLKQTITGNAGINILRDGAGAGDVMKGLGGDDTYQIYSAATKIQEDAGLGTADRVMAAVDFRLATIVQVEIMTTNGSTGTSGIDLTGNDFDQQITGNYGNNRLEGRGGNDTLRGFAGNDTFVVNTALGASNIDTIVDFNVSDDRFLLSDAIFTALTTGTLSAAAFRANTTGLAEDADDHIIYETDTGKLFYDADGLGGAAGIQFAKVAVGLALTNADFSVA